MGLRDFAQPSGHMDLQIIGKDGLRIAQRLLGGERSPFSKKSIDDRTVGRITAFAPGRNIGERALQPSQI